MRYNKINDSPLDKSPNQKSVSAGERGWKGPAAIILELNPTCTAVITEDPEGCYTVTMGNNVQTFNHDNPDNLLGQLGVDAVLDLRKIVSGDRVKGWCI